MCHFLPQVLIKISPVHGDAGQMVLVTRKGGLVTSRFVVTGSVETPSLWTAFIIVLYTTSAIPVYS